MVGIKPIIGIEPKDPMNISQTFPISGMTCSNCAAKVTTRLLEHPQILSAEVVLDPPEARITAKEHLSTQNIEDWLKPLQKYHVTNLGPSKENLDPTSIVEEKNLQTYRPLLILASYLIAASIAGAWGNGKFDWGTAMRLFMGGFFVAFSFFKMLDLKGFADAYRSYDIAAKAFPTYGYIYPFIELALGLGYLANWQPIWVNLLTLIVMGVSLLGVIRAVLSKRVIQCACLGTVFNLPMSTVTIVEDLLMLVMAGAALMTALFH